MDAQPIKSFTAAIREWTQFLLVLFTSIFGIYTFIYKEITAPKAAPVNITLDLQTRRAGVSTVRNRPKKGKLVAIEIKVVAKNPRIRTIYLLRNLWIAYANTIEARHDDDPQSMDEEIVDSLNSPEGNVQIARHGSLANTKIVASGNLFLDDILKPGKAISRSVIIHIPNGIYDHLNITMHIPTAAIEGIELEWQYDSEKLNFVPKLYRVDTSSKRQEVPLDRGGLFVDKQIEYQYATSSADLSL